MIPIERGGQQQLATWYLELVLLHTFGYAGQYWSRLRLGTSIWELNPVPWASTTGDNAA